MKEVEKNTGKKFMILRIRGQFGYKSRRKYKKNLMYVIV